MASTTLITVKDLLNIDKVVMEVTKMVGTNLAGWKSAHVYTYVGLEDGKPRGPLTGKVLIEGEGWEGVIPERPVITGANKK